MFGSRPQIAHTWVEVDRGRYGAWADARGPIGGHAGYVEVVTGGELCVSTLDELIEALGSARKGQVVFIDGHAHVDCTTRVYADELVLSIPAGVTLASDRGANGSQGAMIFSDAFPTRPLLSVDGPGARVVGLRLRGPDPKRRVEHGRRSFVDGRGHDYYYKFPISRGIVAEHPGLEVANCELAGFSHAAVFLAQGDGHHIHHNAIHHNQYDHLGYGVAHGTAGSLVERNVFYANRHSIAGSGHSGSGYEAAHNIEIKRFAAHCFDMHGGEDRRDGTSVAGGWLKIHHNVFCCPRHTRAIMIRGATERMTEIHHNWFPHQRIEQPIHWRERTEIYDNAYGAREPCVLDRLR